MAKEKEKELNDGLSLTPAITGTANTIEDGKWKEPDAEVWVKRINSRVSYLNENEAAGWKTVLDFYRGEVMSPSPEYVSDVGQLQENPLYPIMKSLIDTEKPSLYYRAPAVKIKSTNDDTRFPKADSSLLEYSIRETEFDAEMKAVVHEGVLFSNGLVALDFDVDRMVARARQVNIKDCVVENPDSWRLRDQSWIAIKGRVNLEDAKIYFNNDELQPTKNTPWLGNPNFEETMKNPNKNFGGDQREILFEFWQIFAKYGQKRTMYYVSENETEFLKFKVADPKSTNPEKPHKWVKKSDWPFVLDKEDFPVEFLKMNERTDSFYALNEKALLCPIVLELNIIFRHFSKRTRAAATAKILYDNALDDAAIQALSSGKDFDALGADLQAGKTAKNVIDVFEFPGVSPEAYQHFMNVRGIFDESSGFSELRRGGSGTGRKTATQANIEDRSSTLRSDSKQSKVDVFLKNVTRKMRIINAQLCPLEIAKSVASDEAIDTGVFKPGENGIAPWDERKQDIARIIKEAHVSIEVNSARRRGSQENIALALSLLGQLSVLIDPITGQPIFGATHIISWFRMIVKETDFDDIDSLVPREEEIQQRQQQAMQARAQAMEEEQSNVRAIQEEQEGAQMEERQNQEFQANDANMALVQEEIGVDGLLGEIGNAL